MQIDEKAIAVAFVTDIGKGRLDPDDLSDDFTAWSVTSGISAKNVYLQKLKMMSEIFAATSASRTVHRPVMCAACPNRSVTGSVAHA